MSTNRRPHIHDFNHHRSAREDRERADFVAATDRIAITAMMNALPWQNCTRIVFRDGALCEANFTNANRPLV